MKHVMIDIETLSSNSDAVMIQLAAVFFDPLNGAMQKSFIANIDPETCEQWGFKKDVKTVAWWATQDPAVYAAVTADPQPVESVMVNFYNFLKEDLHDLHVWSHATFDFVIVQNYLQKLNIGYMPFRGAMDIRTLIYLSGLDLSKYDWKKKTHNAIDDCIFQVGYCVDAMKLINNKENKNDSRI